MAKVFGQVVSEGKKKWGCAQGMCVKCCNFRLKTSKTTSSACVMLRKSLLCLPDSTTDTYHRPAVQLALAAQSMISSVDTCEKVFHDHGYQLASLSACNHALNIGNPGSSSDSTVVLSASLTGSWCEISRLSRPLSRRRGGLGMPVY